MKPWNRIFGLCALLFACGGGPSVTPPATADLSGPLGCADVYHCIQACPAAQVADCIPLCINRGDQASHQYFVPLQECGGSHCYQQDGGAPACAVPSSAVCVACVNMYCSAELAACNAH